MDLVGKGIPTPDNQGLSMSGLRNGISWSPHLLPGSGPAQAMMRFVPIAVLFMFFPSITAAQQSRFMDTEYRGRVGLEHGLRVMDSEWGPVDKQAYFGLAAEFLDGPIKLAVSFREALAEEYDRLLDAEVDGLTFDILVGVRFIEHTNTFNYWGGVGIAYVDAEVTVQDSLSGSVISSDSDSGIGWWLHGGIGWREWKNFLFGMQFDLTTAGVTLFGDNRDAGAVFLGVVASYVW